MRPPDDLVSAPAVTRVRLIGWFFAANALAVLAAVVGAGSATAGAAHQFAVWCGIR